MSSYADVTAKNASQTPKEVRSTSSLMSLLSKFKRKRRRSSVGNQTSRRLLGERQGLFRVLSRALSQSPSLSSTSSTAPSGHSPLSVLPRSVTTVSTSPQVYSSPDASRQRQSAKSHQKKLSVFSIRRRDSASASSTAPSSGSIVSTRPSSYKHHARSANREARNISGASVTSCSVIDSTQSSPTMPTPPSPSPLATDNLALIQQEDGRSLTFISSQKAAKPLPELETTTTSTIAPTSMEPVGSPPAAAAAEASSLPEKPADISSDEAFPEPEKVLSPAPEVPAGGPDRGKKAKGREWPFLMSAADSLKKFIAAAAGRVKLELKNPVVTCNLGTWATILAGAAYYVKIKKGALPSVFTGPNGKYITAAAIAGAVALTATDIIVSTKKYPKYSKK
ncbi:hypothetical protein V1517DRAFT_323804 [Lipomyces orientalis]|uniref:Uncharacterized protein n=1 Tax=Lipomyces orientalis TaxID=1233043 RepID=A0ACC3TMW4_9ASCO